MIDLVQALGQQQQRPSDDRESVEAFAKASAERTSNLVQFQLFAMFFEAFCGLTVLQSDLFWQAPTADWLPRVEGRSVPRLERRWRPIRSAEALHECVRSRAEARPPQYT